MDPQDFEPTRVGKFDAYAREAFLGALRVVPNVSRACRLAGISISTANAAKQKDEAFAAQWLEALDEGVERMEEEAHRRAFIGYPGKPMIQNGAIVAEVTEYSDALAALLLKAHKPGKYRDNVNVTGELTQTVNADEAATKIAALLRLAASRKGADDIL
jgi:hypothetical protein